MADRDKRLDLIIAYREAGLHEKANELAAEVLREQGLDILATPDYKPKLDAIRKDIDDTMNKLADKLGVPRPSPRKRR